MSTLARLDPFHDIADFRRRFERFFDDLGNGTSHNWVPAIDVTEGDGQITLRADLPGITPEDIQVELEDGVLTISGEHEESKEEKDDKYVRRERHYGSFSRSIRVPSAVKADDVVASHEDGVLEVRVGIPKREPQTVKVTAKGA